MKPIPIAQYLSRLEGENSPLPAEQRVQRRESPFVKPRLVAQAAPAALGRPAAAAVALNAAPAIADTEERIAEAYERGVQDGRLEAHAEHAQRQAARDADDESRLRKEREEFQAQEYAQLADAIAAGLIEIEERITGAIARILEPYLIEQQTKLALKALSEDIEKLLSADAPPLLRISGPEELLHILRERLAGLPIEIEYWLDDGVEATVQAHNTRIETQLKNWIAVISAAKN